MAAETPTGETKSVKMTDAAATETTESKRKPNAGKRKGPVDIIWLNAGRDKPMLFSLDFDDNSKSPCDHFLNAIKSQVFGVRPGVYLEYRVISPTLTMLYLETGVDHGAVNRALHPHGWVINNHAVVYKSKEADDENGDGVDVFFDLTQKHIDKLGAIFSADKRQRAKSDENMAAKGNVVPFGSMDELLSFISHLNAKTEKA